MASSQKILLVGGYGKTGNQIAQLLVDHSNYSLTLAGRHQHKAEKTANAINKTIADKQCKGIELDITDVSSLKKVIPEYDLLINCVPFPSKGDSIVQAIANADIHYVDSIPSSSKQVQFENCESIIAQNNKICVLEAGWEPGLPALLARLGAQKLNERVVDIELHAVYKDREMTYTSVADIIGHAQLTAASFENGKWVRNSIFNTQTMHFPSPFGIVKGYPTELGELRTTASKLGLKSLKLYQGGYGLVCDLVLFIWTIFGLRKSHYLLPIGIKLFQWANKRFTTPPFGGMIKTRINTNSNSLQIIASTEDLYQATAIPIVVTAKQILDQKIDDTGVHFMGSIVEPMNFEKEITKMGITIEIQ